MREVCVGPVGDLPEGTCRAVGDGAAIVVRSGRDVRAFANRCLHQDSPLAGGWVRRGVLTCPQHFWRYAVGDGHRIGGPGCLTALPVRLDAGQAWVEIPDTAGDPPSLRQQLLARARSWDRDAAFEQTQTDRPRGTPC